MKYYRQLIELGCFNRDDAEAITGNRETAHSMIEAYKKKGLIECVRRDLFVVMSFETKQPVPSRFAIASHAAPGAYVSHHSAFEYHGLANQVYYTVYAASRSRFRPFEYGGLDYRYVTSHSDSGVESKPGGIRVTDLERTVLDGINDFEKVGGLDELLRCLELIPYLDSRKLSEYLALYRKAVIYQKAGYILEHFKDDLKLTDCFFGVCQKGISQGKRYLYHDLQREPHVLSEKWLLYVPADLLAVIRKGASVQ